MMLNSNCAITVHVYLVRYLFLYSLMSIFRVGHLYILHHPGDTMTQLDSYFLLEQIWT
jgi:hypothetical protein